MGLEIPERIEEERYMWWSLTYFVHENDPKAMENLNRFRKRKSVPAVYADEGPEKRTEAASENKQDEQNEQSDNSTPEN